MKTLPLPRHLIVRSIVHATLGAVGIFALVAVAFVLGARSSFAQQSSPNRGAVPQPKSGTTCRPLPPPPSGHPAYILPLPLGYWPPFLP
jgi:hypothetical protein